LLKAREKVERNGVVNTVTVFNGGIEDQMEMDLFNVGSVSGKVLDGGDKHHEVARNFVS
jgi:hypothetical protein